MYLIPRYNMTNLPPPGLNSPPTSQACHASYLIASNKQQQAKLLPVVINLSWWPQYRAIQRSEIIIPGMAEKRVSMFKIRTSKYRHVFCDAPKAEVRFVCVCCVRAFGSGLVAISGPMTGGRGLSN